MEETFAVHRRKRDRRLESKNVLNSKLDLSRRKVEDCPHKTWYQGLKWNLPASNKVLPHQTSTESSEEEWSDFSFYDLPESLKEPFPRAADPAEFILPLHMVSRPPYHATAEAHCVHAFLDSETSNPFSSVMEDSVNQTQGCSITRATQGNSRQKDDGYEIQPGGNRSASEQSQDCLNVSSDKVFDGSLYYRHSDVVLHSKERGQDSFERPQHNGRHCPASSSSQVQTKVPPTFVSTELSKHNSSKAGSCISGISGNSESSSYLERLQRSFPSSRSHTNSYSQDTVRDKFLKRSVEASHGKDKHRDNARSRKEHSPKSVSFATSVKELEKSSKLANLDIEEDSVGPIQNVSATPVVHKVQSNVMTAGIRQKLLESSLQNGSVGKSQLERSRQQTWLERADFDTQAIPLPPSPPTRDTNRSPSQLDSQTGSVQVLSLFDQKGLFAPNFSGSFPRQSNVNLSFDGRKGSSFDLKRDWFVRQSNSKVDFPPRRSLRDSKDASLTLEDLLSSRSVNSSPENSPSPKFERSSYRGIKEHSLDDYDDQKGNLLLQDLSLRNSFSVDTSQRISSALWAMKLLEASRTSSPNSYQDLLIKGRLFRRWYQKTRLKRLTRQEDEIKLQSAVSFWQTEMQQKCFVAWRNARQAQQEKADQLRRKQMLQKGLRALRFAVNQQKQATVELQTRITARIMAKYWLKWQRCVQMKVTARLREAFDKWHMFKVGQDREAVMEGMADRHVLSKNYKRWKLKYETEQKNGVASLHYKIGLLTKSWHSWRLYSTQKVVKTRLKEVARVHYEEHLQARLFAVWKENTQKAVVAHNLTSKRLLIKAMYCWKNWTQYAKIIRLRFQSMCKEYHRHKLVKQAFHHWQIRLMNRRADRRYNNGLQRKIFKLWFLRYKKKVIHRHLCKALAKKGKKRRFFNRWSSYTKQQTETRRTFVGTLERMLTSIMFNNWREHVRMRHLLGKKEFQLTEKKNKLVSRKMMDRWLFAMEVVKFRKKVKTNWTRRCTRKACEAWKSLLKRKYLEQRWIDNRSIWEQLIMKRMFKKWRQQKRRVDAENEKVLRVRAILTRNYKARVLQAWRVVNQEQQIISPMVARRDRKEMTRVFDAWRLHVHRQKHIVDKKTRATEKIIDKYFLFWRDRAYLRMKEREVVETLMESKLSRAFTAWKTYVKNQRHDRLKMRARRFQLMERYYTAWKQMVKTRAEEKVEETGKEARNTLLVRWSFKFWRTSAEQQKEVRFRQNETADEFHKSMVLREAWVVWLRRYRVEEWARDHAQARKGSFLRKVFQAWRRFTTEILQREMQQFATSLSGLDSSFGSFAASPFRNTLGSTLGSTFASTLGSPTMSDALTSSGYGASVRRGSGSVFIFGMPPKERDDDTASLPGRIDQIDHLLRPGSLNTRPLSPISILRDSRPVSPFVANSNHTSPAPSPSPEHHLPSTPPIRYQDFSPVKSEDDTGIHSGSSESDHEEDRMSTASCTSFTGRSTQSELRDRELMATETILHWRNLPLSLTFRTWLKYTRQRKLQKELLNYLTNNKINELMVKTLATWRRELHTKVTARQHWLDTSRRKCLRAWHEYADTKMIQDERKVLADKHCRLARLKGGFQKWKKRCSSKKKLQTLIGQWQKKAIVSEQDKGSTLVIQKKQNARFARQAFMYWAQLTRKSQEAKRMYMERLLPKCFGAWHVLASTRVTNRRKVALFGERRLLTMAFREWQARFQAVSRVDEFIEIKETDRLSVVLRGWHAWANGMTTRRKQARLFRRSVELKIMREIFIEWLGGAQRLQLANRTHDMHIMKSVFVCWKNVALERARNRLAMQRFRNNSAANLLARSFRFWQQLQAHSEVSRAYSQGRDLDALRECFEEWHEYTLEIRADKFIVTALQKKMFLCWYDEYTSRKTTRRLIHTWKTVTEEAKVLNARAMRIAEDSEKKLLRRMFDFWVQEAHKVQKAKNHVHGKMMRSTLLCLRQYVHCRVERRRRLQETRQNKEHALLARSFKTWKESFERNVRNMEALDEHLQKKDVKLLNRCLVKWKKFMLRCKAEKSYQRKLVAKSFQRWWFALYTKKGSEKLQEKMLLRRTREAGLHWKRFTYRMKKQAAMADDLQAQQGRRLVHSYFHQWTEKTRQMQRAKELRDKTTLKRSLQEWRKVARKRIDERKAIKSFQDQLMNKKVCRMFHQWRVALKLACKQKTLIDGQMVHHNKRVKQGCLREWKKFTLRSRAEKHCNKKITLKFFSEWKAKTEQKLADKEKEKQHEEIAFNHYQITLSKMCFRAWQHDVKLELLNKKKERRIVQKHYVIWKKRISLNTIASEMVVRRVYEKFWTKWRHQLIRKRVSEMMMKHEEKKQLSEVFMAWYQLTLVNRRLLKEWQTYKTKKIFRLWMQKYNES